MATEKVSSILRALNILECFTEPNKNWTLKELVDYLGLPQTTVFRQVSTLMDKQYIIQDPINKTYKVGPQLLMLSSCIVGNSDIRSTCRPELERLSSIVHETINLTAINGYEVFYLDKVETFRSIVCKTKIGTHSYAHATSGGKIFLAFQTPEFQEKYFKLVPDLPPLTENTITSVDALKKELENIKNTRISIDYGEIEPDLICIASPIFDMNEKVVCTVSIAGPKYRMLESLDFMKTNVLSSSIVLSQLFGYRNFV